MFLHRLIYDHIMHSVLHILYKRVSLWHEKWHQFFPLWSDEPQVKSSPIPPSLTNAPECISKLLNQNLWRESTSYKSLHFLCAALIVNLLSSIIRLFYCSLKLSAIAFFKPAAVHWGLCCVEYILRVPLIIIFAPSSNLYQCLNWQSAIFVYGYFFLSTK